MHDSKSHWEQIYSENLPDEVSWFQTQPEVSLRLIESTGIKKDAWIIDVGGGASVLVDRLLEVGFKNLAVLDISNAALEHAKKRLGDRSEKIEWHNTDVTTFKSPSKFSLWHDRAVLHFLTQKQDQQHYLNSIKNALSPGCHLIVATFAIGGPTKCSGLEIVQYDASTLKTFFGDEFVFKESREEIHHTPWNSEQKFVYCRFQRVE